MLIECEWLHGLANSKLAPYVICVVADRTQQSLTVSYELRVNEDVWKPGYDWGIAGSNGTPTHRTDWSHYEWGFDFHMQKPQVEVQCVVPLEHSFY